MSKLTIAVTNDTKVVPLNTKNNLFTLADFFAAYGANTNDVMLQLLTNMFKEYKKTRSYQYLSFGQKVDVEFQYELLCRLIKNLKK